MGCQSSKMVRVAPAIAAAAVTASVAAGPGVEPKGKQVAAENVKNAKISRNESRDSLNSFAAKEEEDVREKSAVSKASRKSGDSGFYHDDAGPELDGDESGHIITEHSDTQLVMQIESNFRPVQDLDLSLCGVPAPRNLSAKEKTRKEEQQIIETLRQEGLIAKPQTAKKSGLSFEIVQATPAGAGAGGALPARLSKLELSQRKRRKKATSKSGIQSIAEASDGNGSEVNATNEASYEAAASGALSKEAAAAADEQQQQQQQQQQAEQQQLAEKEKSALENRERRLQELVEKLKAKEAHAATVRERKKQGAGSLAGEAQSEERTF